MVDSQAIDATDLVVSVRDRSGRYVLVNGGFEELTGLPRDRLQGKRDAALNPQDIAEKVALHDAMVFDTGAPSEVDEELLGREGRVPVRSCRFAICNDEGEPWAVCSVSASRDEVERVRAERDRLAAIADGTPKPHSAVTSERLDTLVADLATARETAGELTEALEAERNARQEQAEALEAERNARQEQAEALETERAARAEAEAARGEAEAARAEADAARAEAEAARAEAEAAAARDAARATELAGRAEAAEERAAAAEERATAAEKQATALSEQLQHERAAAAKLSERVKSLESEKRSAEGGLLHTVRLRHEHKRLASQLETERRSRHELVARIEQDRSAHETTQRNLERTRYELDAAREESETARAELETAHADLQTARAELEALRAELEARPAAPLAGAAANGAAAPSAASASAASASLVAVQRRVADLISDSSSLEGAMRSGLAAFGELAGWDAAVGWLLARDGAWLRPASVWCSQSVAGSTFETQTWQAILDDGPRAIAAAWEATEPVWIEDAGEDEDRPRCRWARAAGLTTAVAVPVLVDGERRGMIEVYRRDRNAHDEDVLAVLETIATQLGSIERLLELADRPRWR